MTPAPPVLAAASGQRQWLVVLSMSMSAAAVAGDWRLEMADGDGLDGYSL
jgi:hypothetical protein